MLWEFFVEDSIMNWHKNDFQTLTLYNGLKSVKWRKLRDVKFDYKVTGFILI